MVYSIEMVLWCYFQIQIHMCVITELKNYHELLEMIEKWSKNDRNIKKFAVIGSYLLTVMFYNNVAQFNNQILHQNSNT